ncbi:hypothetical protein OE88DRAFT_1644921 [Heliocybe sulcata]|uniref:Uncharacterized protein n=1 Tax=Heliocybe sulcata TaxID=5364 RepID=A0A5C3N142_9AGAM|nr:hypothetical protein OE88DRAFT_1644921 [Heliocybe sulcata]
MEMLELDQVEMDAIDTSLLIRLMSGADMSTLITSTGSSIISGLERVGRLAVVFTCRMLKAEMIFLLAFDDDDCDMAGLSNTELNQSGHEPVDTDQGHLAGHAAHDMVPGSSTTSLPLAVKQQAVQVNPRRTRILQDGLSQQRIVNQCLKTKLEQERQQGVQILYQQNKQLDEYNQKFQYYQNEQAQRTAQYESQIASLEASMKVLSASEVQSENKITRQFQEKECLHLATYGQVGKDRSALNADYNHLAPHNGVIPTVPRCEELAITEP